MLMPESVGRRASAASASTLLAAGVRGCMRLELRLFPQSTCGMIFLLEAQSLSGRTSVTTRRDRMLATDLVVGRKNVQRAKPQDAEYPLCKIIFIGPAKAGKARSVTLMGILMA